MKKFVALFLALLMVMALTACGGGADSSSETALDENENSAAFEQNEESSEEAEETTRPAEKSQEVSIGDTVSTDWIEFTLNEITYTSYWGPNGEKNKAVSSENVCANAFYTVKNIGKKAFNSVTAAWVVLDYDNGYTYNQQETCHKSLKGGAYYVGTWDDIPPLTDAVDQVCYFEIPQQIQEDSEHSLHINVTLKYEDGTEETFVYVIR